MKNALSLVNLDSYNCGYCSYPVFLDPCNNSK